MEETLNVTRVFSCSEFKGYIFLKQVAQGMKENRHREINNKKARGSMIAFMWGRKLALLTERIEMLKSDHNEDYGPIYWNGQGKFLGYYSEYFSFDIQKYLMYLNQLKLGWNAYISPETALEIEKKLNFILESDAFQASRNKENIGIVPDMTGFLNLRTFSYKEKPNLSNMDYIDSKLTAMNDLYGETAKEMEMHDFAIVDVFPAKYHKRHMAANML